MQIKTTMRYHFTPVRMAIIKSLQTINAGEGMEKREHCYTVGGNANLYRHCGEQYGNSLIPGNRTAIRPRNPTPRKPELKETHVPQCSLQHCLQ